MNKGIYSDNPIAKKYEKETGVHINWNEILDTAWNEKTNLMIASRDLPHMFYGGELNNVVDIIDAGLLRPFDQYIDKWMPTYKQFFKSRPDLLKMHKYQDGKLYYLIWYMDMPWQVTMERPFINKMWLDKLGLKVPETTKEYYETLKAFKANDPNGNGKADEIPLSLAGADNSANFNNLFGSFGVVDSKPYHIMLKDKKVIFAPMQNGYRKGLEYFHQLFKEGLLDSETLTQKIAQVGAKGRAQDIILGSFVIGAPDSFMGIDRVNNYVPIKPLAGPDGTRLWRRYNYVGGPAAYITSFNKYPEITARWLEYTVKGENSLLSNLGPKDLTWRVNGNKYEQISDYVPPTSTYNILRFTNALGTGPMIRTDENIGLQFMLDDYTRRVLDASKVVEPYVEKENWPVLPLKKSTNEDMEMGILASDIDRYITKFLAESIANGVGNWDEHIDMCKKLNVGKLVDYLQKRYDDYIK